MRNRELLMLAKDFDDEDSRCSNCFVSVKLDGVRAFWDGGCSRGMLKTQVPWANNDKDKRYVNPPVATGLWSRYGNVIHAPNWFLDGLPRGILLDGELWTKRGELQTIKSITSQLTPDERWKRVQFMVFGMPRFESLWVAGQIRNPNFEKYIDGYECKSFMSKHGIALDSGTPQFIDEYPKLVQLWTQSPGKVWFHLKQFRLPVGEEQARERVQSMLEKETDNGGEGLMIRTPFSFWQPYRVASLLKVKKLKDSEAEVLGYVWGEEGKEGKLLGLMGSVTVGWNDQIFQLSGFTHEERTMCHVEPGSHNKTLFATEEGYADPGGEVADGIYNPRFPIGSKIRFRYTQMTDDGIPREARYYR